MPTFEAISSPVLTDSQRLTRTTAVVLAGTLLLTAASWIAVPLWPVPVTMQTYAVIALGALLGARLGTLTIFAWFAEAVMGLPVLAHGSAGLVHFFGPTGGYLVSYPIIAAFTGWLADRKLDRAPVALFGSMIAANAINLGLGVLWLTTFAGFHYGLVTGFTPFWIGGILQASLATATVLGLRRSRFFRPAQ
jgi:biotin transport system substrate-specific component